MRWRLSIRHAIHKARKFGWRYGLRWFVSFHTGRWDN